jgi:hypothetical protein
LKNWFQTLLSKRVNLYRYVVVLIEAALPLLFLPEGGGPACCCASAGSTRDDDHARDTMEAAVHVAGAVRNLRYANAPNRAAVAAAGALEAVAEDLRRATLDGGRNKRAVAGTNLVVAQSSMGNTVSSRSCGECSRQSGD